ncbi:MAG TPA: GNAT family N-acetyltransferase [Allosphingosinicella sp.]|jgi:GNAT superfamily N-acetyltransferase
MISIRPATHADSEILGIIGPAAYAAAYSYLWRDPAALAEHLESFGPAGVAAFLSQPGARIWLAEHAERAIGFLSLLPNSPEPVATTPHGAEIPRIFLLPGARGKGVGQRLLAPAREAAQEAGASYLWLDAMASADWAIGAYRKWGFTPAGSTVFAKPVDPDLAKMVVMTLPLTRAGG